MGSINQLLKCKQLIVEQKEENLKTFFKNPRS